MSSEMQTLRFEQQVKAPVEEVYRAFTNATALREWMCDVATVDPKPGGRFYAAWNNGFYVSGEYTLLEPGKEMGFTWYGRGYPGSTEVRVALVPAAGGTRVNLEHSGIGTGEAWTKTRAEITQGWENSLENLASVMETGEDLRFTSRPMMGISFGQFGPEDAKKLDVPVTEGIRLDGLVEDMGAYAAGLRSDDVIVSMAGKPVSSLSSLTGILQSHKAGDEVEVVFYRGPEKRTVLMKLSRRPIPEIPATPKELAVGVRARYAAQDEQLRSVMENITEEQADYRPAPGEWSIKDNLAHLILGEQFNGFFIEELETRHERWADDWSENSHAHTRGLVSAYPTLPELIDELRRSEALVVGTLEALPDSFNKAGLWRLAYGLLQTDTHLQQHLDAIRSLAEAAGR